MGWFSRKAEQVTETAELREARAAVNRGLAHLLESQASLWDSYVDPREAYLGPDGELWNAIGTAAGPGIDLPPYSTDGELDQIRNKCRWLSRENEFAINGHENRISYIVGFGHTYTVVGRSGETPPDCVARVQTWLDSWLKVTRWTLRQQEALFRGDRDGETFLRLFRHEDGFLRVRFVEACAVRTPPSGGPCESFGIKTDPDDMEEVEAYWVVDADGRGEWVPAAAMQHRKYNLDSGSKRGLPLFYPVRKNLSRAEKILRNMSTAAAIQAAIALIRKHQTAAKEAVKTFVNARANMQVSNSDGTTGNVLHYPPGSIIDAPQGTAYEFPKDGLDPAKFVVALQAELRAISARLVMPEFMLTSDASNANFASTMVAEGPAVKKFERDQQVQVEHDREIIDRALSYAVECGLLAAADVAAVKVNAEPPSVKSRDEVKDAQAAQILSTLGWLSPQTGASRFGLDYQTEQDNLEQHQERTGGLPGVASAVPAVMGGTQANG